MEGRLNFWPKLMGQPWVIRLMSCFFPITQDMWNLSSPNQDRTHAVQVWSLSHWSTREVPASLKPHQVPFHSLSQPFLCRQKGLLFCTPAWGRVGGRVRDGRNAHQPCLLPLATPRPAVLATLLALLSARPPQAPWGLRCGVTPPGSPLLFLSCHGRILCPWHCLDQGLL